MSREQLAASMGVSKESVDNWCSHRNLITLPHLDQLALFLQNKGCPRDLVRHLVTEELNRQGLTQNFMGVEGEVGNESENSLVVVISSQMLAPSGVVALGICEGVRASGTTQAMFLDTCGREDVFQYYLSEGILRFGLKGLIVSLLPLDSRGLLTVAHKLRDRRIPVVFVGAAPSQLPLGCASVHVDSYHVGALAAEALLSAGKRDVVIVAPANWLMGTSDVMNGCSNVIQQFGGSCKTIWALESDLGEVLPARGDRPTLNEAAESIAADRTISSILVLGGWAAPPVVKALLGQGRVPGRDVSVFVVGCTNWMHNGSIPPISHLALPYYEQGREAVRLLITLAARELNPEERNLILPLSHELLHCYQGGSVASTRRGMKWQPQLSSLAKAVAASAPRQRVQPSE